MNAEAQNLLQTLATKVAKKFAGGSGTDPLWSFSDIRQEALLAAYSAPKLEPQFARQYMEWRVKDAMRDSDHLTRSERQRLKAGDAKARMMSPLSLDHEESGKVVLMSRQPDPADIALARMELREAAKTLRGRRICLGLTQGEVAERLGCSTAYVAQLEARDKYPVSSKAIEKYHRLLSKLSGGEGDCING